MEIAKLYFIILTTFLLPLIFTILLIQAWRKSKVPKESLKLPPSPPKLPIIAHLHYLTGGLPHRVFAKISQNYGHIFHLQLGETLSVVISSREAAEEVLKVQDLACANRPTTISGKIVWYNYSDIAFSPYGEYWKQMRKICVLEMLSTQNVKSFGFIREDEGSCLVESIRSSCGENTNLTKQLFALSSSITCRVAFGEIRRDYDGLISLMKTAHVMAGGFELVDLFPSLTLMNVFSWNKYKLLRMRRKLDAILDNIVEEHRAKQRGEFGNEDIVDVLLRVQKNGNFKFPITNDNIKAVIFDMFTGGTETSSTTIDWAMAELMKNPRVMAKAQAELREALNGKSKIDNNDLSSLKYLKLVIKETLRLHPPIPIIPRECREECTVDGYLIPLKSKVLINIWAIGRNPEYWHDPETFKPERFLNTTADFLGNNFEYIPFGYGRRMCPGMQFGLANIELPLAQLLYHFDWKMPKGLSIEDIDMSETGGIAAARKCHLFLVPNVCDASN